MAKQEKDYKTAKEAILEALKGFSAFEAKGLLDEMVRNTIDEQFVLPG